MQYQVFVQSQGENGFLAAVIGMPECMAEGHTEEEAVSNAKNLLTERLAQGKIVTIDVAAPEAGGNPLLDLAGSFKDDPTFDDFLAEVEEYRRELDAPGDVR